MVYGTRMEKWKWWVDEGREAGQEMVGLEGVGSGNGKVEIVDRWRARSRNRNGWMQWCMGRGWKGGVVERRMMRGRNGNGRNGGCR